MNPIDRLTQAFERFPGIGPRQARRFVQFLLVQQPSFRLALSQDIAKLGAMTFECSECHRWSAKNTEKGGVCSICGNSRRDASILFVVEKDADLENVEKSGFKGLYFVLGGTIPLASEEPHKHVRLHELVARVERDGSALKLNEVIFGLSATTEGDHTRQILAETLRPMSEGMNFKLSSLGRGLSTGSELEYADPDTIASALSSRN
ncbi:MAG TPA: toprim domain-containing protein [Candidatus Paceibacterota bacterium]|nr:toprim domain-containing protein [Candidatus Paceibacterota bacterium]